MWFSRPDPPATRLERLGSYRIDVVPAHPPHPFGEVRPARLKKLWRELIAACVGAKRVRDARAKDLNQGGAAFRAAHLSRYSDKITIKTRESVVGLLHEIVAPDAPWVCDESCPHLRAGLSAAQAHQFVASLDAAIASARHQNATTRYDHPRHEDSLDELQEYEGWRHQFLSRVPNQVLAGARTAPERARVVQVRRRWYANERALLERVMERGPIGENPRLEEQVWGGQGGVKLDQQIVERLGRRIALVCARIPPTPEAFIRGQTQNPHDTEQAFDPNLFLLAFEAVPFRQEYVLDYVWQRTEEGGAPLVYLRKVQVPPFTSVADYAQVYGPPRAQAGETGDGVRCPEGALRFHDTPRGLLEVGLFLTVVPRFHLWGSAEQRALRAVAGDPPEAASFAAVSWDGTARKVYLALHGAGCKPVYSRWDLEKRAAAAARA